MERKRGISGGAACGVLLFFLFTFVREGALAGDPGRSGPRCLLIPLSSALNEVAVQNAIEAAGESLAGGRLEHVIVELSPSGAERKELMRLGSYIFGLREKGVRTCALVLPTAEAPAATAVALACGKIALAPGSRLGGLSKLGLSAENQGRILSWARTLGRPASLVRRMLGGKEEIAAYRSSRTGKWVFLTRSQFQALPEPERAALVEKRVIAEDNEPVFLKPTEAHAFGVIDYVVQDRMELLMRLGLQDLRAEDFKEVGGGGVFREGKSGRAIAEFFQKPFIRFLLILGGMLGLFLEFQLPGFGVPGLVGLGCFAVFFGTGLITGYVNTFELILFLGSLALIGLELLVIPGFGVAGVLGITGLLVSLVLAMYRGGGGSLDWDELTEGLLTTFLSVACGIVSIYFCAKYLPKNPFVRKAGLVHEESIWGDARPGTPPAGGDRDQWPIGAEGVAVTALRPSGKVKVGDRLIDVVTESDFIEAGTPVVVVRKVGPRTVVRARRELDENAS